MSFREYDKKTFLIDAANDFTAKRISKRSFLKKAAMAGVGFSAFNLGLLGNVRKNRGFVGTPAFAEDTGDPAVNAWLKEVGSKFKGTKIRYTSEATPHFTIGKTTLVKLCQRVAPSIMAAWSMSCGTSSKKDLSSNTAIGKFMSA